MALLQRVKEQVRRLPILNRSHTARQFVKFCIVGFTNTAWDFGVYLALTRGWFGFSLHFLAANSVSFTVGVINSYLLNKRWTFRHQDRRHHVLFSKFFLVNLVSLGAYEFLLYLFVSRLGFYDLVGKAMSIVIVTIWNFSANKYWTFRQR